MYDMIIIGSGPAGLSAAVYGKRAGLDLLVIEAKPMCGGQILNTYEVDNYLGLPGINGFDLGMKFKEHADAAGAEFRTALVRAVRDEGAVKVVETADGNEYRARTLILAAGAEHAPLGVPGEKEYTGKGVSYCATCDGAFFRGKDTAVVGGGDAAVEDAVYLARMCRKVYLIHRRDSLRAAGSLQEKLRACANVEILWQRTVQSIYGAEQVQGIKLARAAGPAPGAELLASGAELLAADAETTMADAQGAEGRTEDLAVDGVFIAVGMHPNTEMFRDIVRCDEQGYIVAGEDCATDKEGIFAAGDLRTKPVRQIITAAADGACAVSSAERYLAAKK